MRYAEHFYLCDCSVATTLSDKFLFYTITLYCNNTKVAYMQSFVVLKSYESAFSGHIGLEAYVLSCIVSSGIL